MIKRQITDIIKKKLNKKKAIIITGARQVGKTTLVNEIANEAIVAYQYWNCDEPDIRQMLSEPTSTQLRQLIGNNKLLIVDEAQRITNIGIVIKLIVDQIKGVQLIITGSSSIELADKINEPLTGRKIEINLFPFTFDELVKENSLLEEKRLLEHRIIYGFYPEVVNNPGEERDILLELSSSYLYKDILILGNIRKPDVLDRLIKALALQIGSQVSYNELAQTVGINKDTISRYIDLLEKSYVIFSLSSFSRNLRSELKRSKKIYFWDTGIRNAVINNFNSLDLRVDKGALWENFLISERIKYLRNLSIKPNFYFWRTVSKQEIDFIEDIDGKLSAYEFKWSPKVRVKTPEIFKETYPESSIKAINKDNFTDFIADV
jgi:uncharacterized protein